MKEEKELFTCSICGCEVDREYLHEFDEEFLCEDCFNDETVICDHCEDRIWRDDNCGDDNINLCSACMEDYYLHCSRCDRIIRCDDACYTDYDEDTPYCDDCYDEIDRECFLHEYSYKPEPIFYGNGKRFFGVELEIDNAGRSSDCLKKSTA